MDQSIVMNVCRIFTEIDRQNEIAQFVTGLHCPPGCGKCCKSDKVEATAAELLPLAEEMFLRGETLFWQERLIIANDSGPCVLYEQDRMNPSNGRCLYYKFRPSVCRLFGLSLVRNKRGIHDLSVCEHIRKTYPDVASKAKESLQNTDNIACISDFYIKLSELWTENRLMPINRAIRMAIDKYGLWMELTKAQNIAHFSESDIAHFAGCIRLFVKLRNIMRFGYGGVERMKPKESL